MNDNQEVIEISKSDHLGYEHDAEYEGCGGDDTESQAGGLEI